jgi:hypothetical protein
MAFVDGLEKMETKRGTNLSESQVKEVPGLNGKFKTTDRSIQQ